jgi:hypothetical protein
MFSTDPQRLHALPHAVKGVVMDFSEKAKIRIEHWIKHNQDHLQEYETFARELENFAKHDSARYIREMAALMAESTDLMGKALKAL